MGDTSPPTGQQLRVERRGSALWLIIDREDRRNALSPAVLEGLAGAIRSAQADRGVRAIVVTGAGTRAFCAGADLQSAQAFTTDVSEPYGAMAQLLRAARASNVPLVARVNGACLAGGMGLLAMCDLAVAAPHARFGLPEVKVGVFPAQVLTVLQALLPRRKLVELCLTGAPIMRFGSGAFMADSSSGGRCGGGRRGAHLFSACEHGLHDVVITGAAAQVAFEVRAHVGLGEVRIRRDERRRAHHHARRAESALQAVAFAERGLHRMQFAVLREPFDRGDVHAVALHGELVA